MTGEAPPTRRLSRAMAVLTAAPRASRCSRTEDPLEAIARSIARIELEHRTLLTTNEVAQLLGASVDTVYRISREELPAHRGAGKGTMYFKDDVLSYVKKRPVLATMSKIVPDRMAASKADMTNVVPFDVEAEIKSLKLEEG